jgi:hypothetical protein
MHSPRPIRLATRLSPLLTAPLLTALLGLWVAFARPAQAAITVALVPEVPHLEPLETFDVAVTIVGIGNHVAPSVGVFELDVSFDPSLLSLGTPVYGDPALGDELGIQETPDIATDASVAGVVNLFELSLDSIADLDTLQAGAFTMVTLPFTALADGEAIIALSVATLGDANGVALAAISRNTQVRVPEPGATLGGAVAFAALCALRRRRRSALAGAAAMMLWVAPTAHAQSASPGDVDQNGRVDRADLAIVTRDRGQSVEQSACGAACDLDGDGKITALDARMLTSLCTDAGCAPAAAPTGSESQH